MAVIEKDLGPVSAYAVAVAHGYTGTEAEWEALIANSAINAQSAGASATAAAASAQEAAQQKTQAQAQAAAAQAHALDASSYAQNAGQANSYAQMASSNAAVSAANASNAQTAAEAAQAAAEAAVTGAEAAQAAAEAAVTDAQTAKTAAETAAATAAAAYGTDLLADDYSTSKTYAVGDYVIYSGNLYRCTTAITTAEAWTADHWTQAQIGPDVSVLKSAYIDAVYPDYKLIPSKAVSNEDGSYITDSTNRFSATEHIKTNGATILKIIATRACIYNAFYDSSDAFVSAFTVQVGTNNIPVPSNASYFAMSNFTANMKEQILTLPALSNTLFGIDRAVLAMSNNGGLTDANSAQINRIYLITDISGVSNLPVAQQGTLITLARHESATAQLYIDASKLLYFRTCWGATWSDWKKILLDGDAITSEIYQSGKLPFTVSNDGKGVSNENGELVDSSGGSFAHTEFLTLAGRGKLIINTDRASAYNAFYDSNYTFISAFTIQIGENILNIPYGASYFRLSNIKANLQSTTIELPVNTSANTLMYQGNLLSAFSNITCCGDSLTWSMVYTGTNTFRQAHRPYPSILGALTGTTTATLAQAGYMPTTWWNAFNAQIVQKDNQLAIIYLGTNNGLTDTLAVDAPENTEPSTWAETQTGYYARIVAAWKAVGAKVLLVNCYATSGTGDSSLENTNKAIRNIADRFGCGLVENNYIADSVYHIWPNGDGQNTNHYNDLGYAYFTQNLINNISFMDAAYLKNLIPQ